jgi:diguanylate cyclase (GGDEF)-like protein
VTDSLDLTLPDAIAKADDLPSMPGVVVEVLRLSKDEEAGIGDFARVISGDPALAIKLLQLSNSSMFSTGHEVKTLDRACMVLGLKTVQLMALSFSLRSSLPEGDAEFLKEYWARSLVAAVAARTFSRYMNYGLDDEAFLCGLLNQLGHLVIAQCMPDEYRGVLERSKGCWPGPEDELEVLGFDSAFVGAGLLKSWELPAPVYLSIAHASRADELGDDCDEEVRQLAQAVRSARLTARVFRDEEKGERLEELRAVASLSGLAEVELTALLDGLGGEVEETAKLLDVEFESGYSAADILEEARDQVMKISLGAAADLHQAERRAHTLESENRQLAEKATTDDLTGIPNRGGFDEVLAAELTTRSARRKPKALGLVMLDADHFKQFNDTHGHRAGDEVLRTLGRILGVVCRGTDVPARYGGEEFAVIAPEVTPAGLEVLAERLRQAIEAETIDFEGKRLEVTVSIGGACIAGSEGPGDAARLIEAADQCLYEAKRDGRNRSVILPELLRPEPSSES